MKCQANEFWRLTNVGSDFQPKWYPTKPDMEILMSGLGKSFLLGYSKNNLGHERNRDLRNLRSRFLPSLSHKLLPLRI